jgi:hypothetical protein
VHFLSIASESADVTKFVGYKQSGKPVAYREGGGGGLNPPRNI